MTPAIYVFADDDVLRSLPRPQGGNRSAFRSDGIVAGSERNLFWPTGVPVSGRDAATGPACYRVRRRHFDDADRLDRYFEMISP